MLQPQAARLDLVEVEGVVNIARVEVRLTYSFSEWHSRSGEGPFCVAVRAFVFPFENAFMLLFGRSTEAVCC